MCHRDTVLFRTETELRLTRVEESVFIIYKYVVFTKRCADNRTYVFI